MCITHLKNKLPILAILSMFLEKINKKVPMLGDIHNQEATLKNKQNSIDNFIKSKSKTTCFAIIVT
jgi:hypothetical protein